MSEAFWLGRMKNDMKDDVDGQDGRDNGHDGRVRKGDFELSITLHLGNLCFESANFDQTRRALDPLVPLIWNPETRRGSISVPLTTVMVHFHVWLAQFSHGICMAGQCAVRHETKAILHCDIPLSLKLIEVSLKRKSHHFWCVSNNPRGDQVDQLDHFYFMVVEAPMKWVNPGPTAGRTCPPKTSP